MHKWSGYLGTSGKNSWDRRSKFWCRNDCGADTPNTARSSSPSLGCGRWVRVCSCMDGEKTARSFPWRSVSVRWRRKRVRWSPVPSATSPSASRRKKRCGGARVIWRKRRGSAKRAVGPITLRCRRRFTGPTKCSEFVDSILKKLHRRAKRSWNESTQRTAKTWIEPCAMQRGRRRNTGSSTESSTPTERLNTSKPSGIRPWIAQEMFLNSWARRWTSQNASGRKRPCAGQADLAHVSRVTTMGELTASLAHEVNQPIAAAVTDANTCLRWLTRDHPDVEEARAAAMRIVKDGSRAADIITRIRRLFKKDTPEREPVDVNEVVREMIVLLRSEATRYSVFFRTELAEDLPQIMGDRVQLQQVIMNLIMNSIDAMKDVDGTRELTIKSQRAENEQLLVSVSDTGVGLPPQQADQIFNAFFTTKPHGTGMGLRISRSIVESHGGRLWAADTCPRGASFCFTLPTKAETHE